MSNFVSRLAMRVFSRSTQKQRVLQASVIDNADTTDENAEHWRKSKDNATPVDITPHVRRNLRMRTMYEFENNSYLSGCVSTRSTDLIGYTLPKLRIATSDSNIKAMIEMAWDAWAKHEYVNLSSKLRIMDETTQTQGESFPVFYSDNDLLKEKLPVSLNLNVLGPTRITDPLNYYHGMNIVDQTYNDDGVIVDMVSSRPIGFKVMPPEYDIYKWTPTWTAETVKPDMMKQWFRPRRTAQYRGYSEYKTSLNLYGQLRRYDLATLTAAEIAAMLAGVMTTSNPVDPDKFDQIKPWSTVDLERGTLLGLPAGYGATQFKPEQPLTQYEMFVNMILRQIGRSLDMPFGIVAGDSSRYNYSSARLDYQGYDARVNYDREQLVIRILNPLFKEWMFEFALANTVIRNLIESNSITWKWTFTKRPSSDPQKDAQSDNQRLTDNTTTFATVYAEQGLDWEEELEQRAKEFSVVRKLGLDNLDKTATMTTDNAGATQTTPTTVSV